jgi:hypothetical protein
MEVSRTELEQATRNKQPVKNLELTTPILTLQANQVLLTITLGSYVCAKPDLSPGMCSYEGSGFITDVNGDGFLRMFTVKYDKSGSIGGKTEAGIPYSCLIGIPSPFGSPKLVRECRRAPITPQIMSIQEIFCWWWRRTW